MIGYRQKQQQNKRKDTNKRTEGKKCEMLTPYTATKGGALNLKVRGKIETNRYYMIPVHKRKHYYALVLDIKENTQNFGIVNV